MKYLILIALLFSCATRPTPKRMEIHWTNLAIKTVPTDNFYESIELYEVKQYLFDTKGGFRTYEANQYDCEDFTRTLINHIMINHDYVKTPAICDARIKGHSLLGFTNNKGEFIYIDAQSGKVVENITILDRIY